MTGLAQQTVFFSRLFDLPTVKAADAPPVGSAAADKGSTIILGEERPMKPINLQLRLQPAPASLVRAAVQGSGRSVYIPAPRGKHPCPGAGECVWTDGAVSVLVKACQADAGVVIDVCVVAAPPPPPPPVVAVAASSCRAVADASGDATFGEALISCPTSAAPLASQSS
jgi:hypothetical protein